MIDRFLDRPFFKYFSPLNHPYRFTALFVSWIVFCNVVAQLIMSNFF